MYILGINFHAVTGIILLWLAKTIVMVLDKYWVAMIVIITLPSLYYLTFH